MLKAILRCMDLRSLPIGIATVIAGTACVSLSGNVLFLPAFVCLLFALFSQLSANLYHRYCDARYDYGENHSDGLSHVRLDNFTIENVLRETSFAFGLLALLVGICIAAATPESAVISGLLYPIISGLLLFGAILLLNNGVRPFSRRPLNVIFPFICFGPIGVITTAYIQVAHDMRIDESITFELYPSLWLSICIGLFAMNYQLFANYASYDKSLEHNNRNYVVAVGLRWTRVTFLLSSLLIFAISLIFAINYHFKYLGLAMIIPVLCTLINFWFLYLMWRKSGDDLDRYRLLVSLNTLLYAIAALIEFDAWGLPDTTVFHYF